MAIRSPSEVAWPGCLPSAAATSSARPPAKRSRYTGGPGTASCGAGGITGGASESPGAGASTVRPRSGRVGSSRPSNHAVSHHAAGKRHARNARRGTVTSRSSTGHWASHAPATSRRSSCRTPSSTRYGSRPRASARCARRAATCAASGARAPARAIDAVGGGAVGGGAVGAGAVGSPRSARAGGGGAGCAGSPAATRVSQRQQQHRQRRRPPASASVARAWGAAAGGHRGSRVRRHRWESPPDTRHRPGAGPGGPDGCSRG